VLQTVLLKYCTKQKPADIWEPPFKKKWSSQNKYRKEKIQKITSAVRKVLHMSGSDSSKAVSSSTDSDIIDILKINLEPVPREVNSHLFRRF
jgi:hypothetical protein